MGHEECESEIYNTIKELKETKLMKRIVAILLMICMVLSLCACRPAVENELPAGSTDTGVTEQTDEGTVETPAEDETETQTPVIDETEEPIIDEGGTPVEDETGTPTESEEHTCTYTEDPELRAKAEAIDSKKNTIEYYHFCEEHDIKMYGPITRNYMPNTLTVTLRKACSTPERDTPDFSCVSATSVINITKKSENLKYEITVPAKNHDEILAAIDTLMKLDCVFAVNVIPRGSTQ